ncbi:MAG TPA: sigma-70 family RNA polymerase sigma factor [Thermoanaerobaculia bacterium]|nr:sigma-70 family RNA polymerase sigma factor [Thermoanaerobaculia bacterium]
MRTARMTAEAVVSDELTTTTPILLATIRAAQHGDSRAFEELMILSERRVANVAWRILGDAEEVKEAMQETFLRVFRYLKRYDESRDFFGWLYRIAVNVCRDLDQRRRRRRIFTPIDDALAVTTQPRTNDDVAMLRRAIDTLPERERLAITLRDIEELSTEDVAEILGNSPATVRVQISKARAKLRAFFGGKR